MQQTTYSKQIYCKQTRVSSLHQTLHQTYLQQQITSNLKQPNLIIFQQPNNDDQTTGNTLVIEQLKVFIEALYLF